MFLGLKTARAATGDYPEPYFTGWKLSQPQWASDTDNFSEILKEAYYHSSWANQLLWCAVLTYADGNRSTAYFYVNASYPAPINCDREDANGLKRRSAKLLLAEAKMRKMCDGMESSKKIYATNHYFESIKWHNWHSKEFREMAKRYPDFTKVMAA